MFCFTFFIFCFCHIFDTAPESCGNQCNKLNGLKIPDGKACHFITSTDRCTNINIKNLLQNIHLYVNIFSHSINIYGELTASRQCEKDLWICSNFELFIRQLPWLIWITELSTFWSFHWSTFIWPCTPKSPKGTGSVGEVTSSTHRWMEVRIENEWLLKVG